MIVQSFTDSFEFNAITSAYLLRDRLEVRNSNFLPRVYPMACAGAFDLVCSSGRYELAVKRAARACVFITDPKLALTRLKACARGYEHYLQLLETYTPLQIAANLLVTADDIGWLLFKLLTGAVPGVKTSAAECFRPNSFKEPTFHTPYGLTAYIMALNLHLYGNWYGAEAAEDWQVVEAKERARNLHMHRQEEDFELIYICLQAELA